LSGDVSSRFVASVMIEKIFTKDGNFLQKNTAIWQEVGLTLFFKKNANIFVENV
jgi:hypothetical protein